MSNKIPFDDSIHIDVEKHIVQAHQMRSEFLAQCIKSGFAKMGRLSTHKSGALKTS